MAILKRLFPSLRRVVQDLRMGLRALNRKRLYRRRRSAQMTYPQWIERADEVSAAARGAWATWADQHRDGPLVGLLLQVPADAPDDLVARTVASVTGQLHTAWRLCIACPPSRGPVAVDHPNIEVIHCEPGTALPIRGVWTALLEVGDVLRPQTLLLALQQAEAHPAAQLLYVDEDQIDAGGQRSAHHFKPDWNPDLQLSTHYLGNAWLMSSNRLSACGGVAMGWDRAGVCDVALRVTEALEPAAVLHLPKVLWHKAAGASRGVDDRFIAPVQAHLDRCSPGARVTGVSQGVLRVTYPIPVPPPLVSIVICTRDQRHLLETCVESIYQRTDYPSFEVLVVDNGSEEASTLSYLEQLTRAHPTAQVIRDARPFNYSALNNEGVAQARGEVIALLNNDIEVIGGGWLTEMVGHALRPEVGCVGAKLLYPDDTVQHVGVRVRIGESASDGIAAHYLRGLAATDPGYAGRAVATQELSAVTAACLVMRKDLFLEVGGFDGTNLAVTYSDVDLCLRVRALGFHNIFTPHALLYHHESVSRGSDSSKKNAPRAQAELAYMHGTWRGRFGEDPFYNPNLGGAKPDYLLG